MREIVNSSNEFAKFADTEAWAFVKNRFSKEDQNSLFTLWAVMGGGNGEKMKMRQIHEKLNEIEKEWEII